MRATSATAIALAILLCPRCPAQVMTSDFDSIKLYTLTGGSGAMVKITNYGAIITSIIVPKSSKPNFRKTRVCSTGSMMLDT